MDGWPTKTGAVISGRHGSTTVIEQQEDYAARVIMMIMLRKG
jgi:hypothetical protein